jgi:thiamine-phosphate pyrophosphorylase
MRALPRLYAIADAAFGDPATLAAALFDGGVRLLQLRSKRATPQLLLKQADAVLRIAPSDAIVIINDSADVALLAGAAGVHIGQDDLPPEAARRVVGSEAIVGVSTHNLEQALAADQTSADYIAVGPLFGTRHKDNPDPPVRLELLGSICRRVAKPVVAIGGITLERAPELFALGVASVAAIGDLLTAPDVTARARQWMDLA